MAAMLIILFNSCIKENIPEINEGNQIKFELKDGGWNAIKSKTSVRHLCGPSFMDTLYVHISSSNQNTAHTKANSVTSENFHKSFGLTAFKYSGDWTEALSPNYIYNEQITEESNWTSSHTWPGSFFNIKFFAYAPYGCKNLTLSGEDYCGTPLMTYEVPDKAEDQTDLTVATSGELSGASIPATSLSFSHIMTGVRILTGENIIPGKITKISINGIYGKGTYSYATNSWEPDAIKSFTQDTNIQISGNAGQSIMDEAQTYMLMPQTLPEGATLTIEFVDALTQTVHQLQADIAGIVLPIGEMVTFRIETLSLSVESVLEVTMPTFTSSGGSATCSIKSYSTLTTSTNSTTIASPWTAEFVEEDGNGGYRTTEKPEWIKTITLAGNGGAGTNTYTLEIAAQELTYTTHHDDKLKATTPVLGVYDLSTNGGSESRTTSNCYIVNAPGTYSLPLVYGNAIKNGADNPNAYKRLAEGLTRDFVNHLNKTITDPYIYNNEGCVPDNARLVWQDSQDLVSDIRLDSEKKNLLFYINPDTIKQGNAVIAVRDASGTVMWSWHIWVTDYNSGADLVHLPYNSVDYYIMPLSVGNCFMPAETYAERKATLLFKQSETNVTQLVDIVQNEEITEWATMPTYQWGFKNPFIPWSGIKNSSTNKQWYDADGNASTTLIVPTKTNTAPLVVQAITNPEMFLARSSNIGSSICFYWNNAITFQADNNANYSIETIGSHIKTICDPCPRGYAVSPHYLIMRLDTYENYEDYNTLSRVYTIGDQTFYFRISGTRNMQTGNLGSMTNAKCWTSLYRYSNAHNHGDSGACDAHAFSVIPFKEL